MSLYNKKKGKNITWLLITTSDKSDVFYYPSRNPNRGGGNKPYVSRKLPTYPSPKPTLTLTSHLRHNVGLGEK